MANSSSIDLFVPGDPNTSTGGYIYNAQILAGLAELGWRTRVHSLDDSFPRPTAAALRDARAEIASLRADGVVVIDGLALAGLERVLDTEAKRLPVVALIHHPLALETGLDPAEARLLETAERAALALVTRVICTSHWTARTLATYGVPTEKIRVVEPGVDRRGQRAAGGAASARPARVDGDPPSARNARDTGKSMRDVRLLCVATVTPRKGHAVLLEALGELRERRWHLTCAGSVTRDPATFAALEHQIERLALRARVSFLGDLDSDALEREYERADLFVLASYLEGYGMALAEAIARGIPVVSTTAGAIPETVPPAAGVLVPPGDSRALAKALATLLDDDDARADLASKARAAAAALPTWRAAAERFAAALEGAAPARIAR
ncbi:MAG TPA: glycosyltransferase family 4 protein [Gammaproteobacteria bacterium]|nr:glycosyltransferase family 4 protein [Gammaproteobacteria bacterium]